LTAVILGILSVAKNYREATAPRRYLLKVEVVVAEKLHPGSRPTSRKFCAIRQNTLVFAYHLEHDFGVFTRRWPRG